MAERQRKVQIETYRGRRMYVVPRSALRPIPWLMVDEANGTLHTDFHALGVFEGSVAFRG